jgi:putative hydrolase of HD superfamily
MAMLVANEFPEADMNKVIRMCLIHDLGEAFTGDIPSFDKTTEDEKKEQNVLSDWVDSFPEPERTEWSALYAEMNALETTEAKIYKALDKMEAVIQHDEADISTWIPLEYDLQFEYGKENVSFSTYMQELKAEVDKMTRDKINRSKNER